MSAVPCTRHPLSVHPHVCGEHTKRLFLPLHIPGSSPRVWGTLLNAVGLVFCFRFIPTCVGNILSMLCPCVLLSVHPHVCGEHKGKYPGRVTVAGSSPRVWGTFYLTDTDVAKSRFIPTCVGNMDVFDYLFWVKTVHPHVCGEHIADHIKD